MKVKEDWRRRCNKRLVQCSFVYIHCAYGRTSGLSWVGRVNRMDSNRKLSKVFKNKYQGSSLTGRPKKMMGLFTNRY